MRTLLTTSLFALACLAAAAVGHELASAPARTLVITVTDLPVGVDPICEQVQR